MSFDHLWAGWRSAYVDATGADTQHPPDYCVFCDIFASDAPDEVRHVISETPTVAVILNAYPYATGHVMVMPKRHVRELEELTDEEAEDLWPTLRMTVEVVKRAYSPDGLNLGVNLGRAAGAGIPGHLHVHVVPRWIGDTNFMTTTASVRVLPESLEDTWKKLRAAWL